MPKRFITDAKDEHSMKTQTETKQDNSTLESFNSNMNGVPFVEINYDLYKAKLYGLTYKDVDGEAVRAEQLIRSGFHFILEGDKGLGKTLLVNDLCHTLEVPLVPINCSSATTEQDLLGHTVIRRDGTFAFQLGIIPIGILCANKFGKAVIYADECNTPNPDVQKIWNSVLDDRRMCIANNHIFRVNEGCQLTVIGTMNPLSYSGVNAMNEDLISRFVGEVIKLPSKETLKTIINWGKLPSEDADRLLTLSEDVRNLRNSGTVDYSLSTRDMQQFANVYTVALDTMYHQDAINMALRMTVLFKMPTEEQRESVKNIVKDIFGVTMA